jgi:hypothetical protein
MAPALLDARPETRRNMPCDPIWQPSAPWEILEMAEPSVELTASLEWRRACARFRRDLQAAAAGRSVADLLWNGAAGLARLARHATPEGDRLRLQDLRERIAERLQEDPAEDPGTDLLLRKELYDLADLLSGVSRRPEVREHDRDLLDRVRRELARTRTGVQVVPPVVRVLLDGLFGRDDELDELLGRRGRVARADLGPILARIAADLGQPEEPVH